MQPRPPCRLLASVLLLLSGACRPLSQDELTDVAQAVGELLASVDEASQGGGFAALWLRRPAALEPPWHERLWGAAWPGAEAHATCAGLPFSACDGGLRERALDGCYLGWGYLEVSLWTHDAGALTELDHLLAADIDRCVAGMGCVAGLAQP